MGDDKKKILRGVNQEKGAGRQNQKSFENRNSEKTRVKRGE